MIVADTGAIVALIDADDHHHAVLRRAYEARPAAWVLPWAILPEVDYLLLHHVGAAAEQAFVRDVAEGRWSVEWGDEVDVSRAAELCGRYEGLKLGLVDGVVIGVAERLKARSIATLDLRHFSAVQFARPITLLPRDLPILASDIARHRR